MQPEEQEIFLRNVLLVAHADETLHPAEEALLEQLRASIGMKKALYNRACKGMDNHAIDLSRISRLSDRIKNIEDMVEMALIDGEMESREKAAILDAARSIAIGQEQINMILTEARMRTTKPPSRCRSCGADAEPAAKFCPQCGSNIATVPERTKSLAVQISSDGITISFAKSTAASFGNALRIAKQCSSFQQAEIEKKQWYAASYALDAIERASELARNLGSIRNREVHVLGERRDWNDVFNYVRCAEEREQSYRPVEYCFGLDDGRFNIWGCKRLSMDWTTWADWFTFGAFTKPNVFEFDKERLSHELNARLSGVQFCPHLRPEFISAVLQLLPSRVKVGPKTEWDYLESYQPDPRAINITVVRDYGDGFREKVTISAVGVKPKDSSLALDIIKRAVAQCKIRDIDHRKLR